MTDAELQEIELEAFLDRTMSLALVAEVRRLHAELAAQARQANTLARERDTLEGRVEQLAVRLRDK